MSIKLGGITCDGCSVLVVMNGFRLKDYIKVLGKKRTLHYCSETCKGRHSGKAKKESD